MAMLSERVPLSSCRQDQILFLCLDTSSRDVDAGAAGAEESCGWADGPMVALISTTKK